MHKGAKGYAMRALAAVAVGCVVALGGCGMESATQVQPTTTATVSVAPAAIAPTATPTPSTAIPAPSTAMLFTTHDTTRLAAPRFDHTAALLPDGRVILGGGSGGIGSFDPTPDNLSGETKFIAPLPAMHFDVYDPAKGWSVISPLSDDRVIFPSSMVLTEDGAIMVVGSGVGETGEDFIAAAALDPETQLWTPLPAPSISTRYGFLDFPVVGQYKFGPLLAPLQDGRVIAIGARQFTKDDGFAYLYTGKSEIFDPRSGQWQSVADTNHASEFPTILALQNGGALLLHDIDSAAAIDADEIGAEIYDPDADEWTVLSGIQGARANPKAVVLSDGRVLVIGATSSDLLSYMFWGIYADWGY